MSKPTPPEIILKAVADAGGQAAFGRQVGLRQQYVCKVVNGQISISAEKALHIEAATDGKISKSALRPDIWPANEGASA